jgi:type II secretory pathway component PulF
MPLVPLLEQGAKGLSVRKARMLLDVAGHLRAGEPLSKALQAQGPQYFPDRVILAIRTGTGTAQLATMLDLLAKDVNRALASRHRFVMALLYPALVGGVLVVVGFNWLALGGHILAEFATTPPPTWHQPLSVLLWASMTLLLLIHATASYLHRPDLLGAAVAWLIPPVRRARRLLHGERLLRGVALLVRAGMPLAAAMRSCATTIGDPGAARATLASAALIESGAPADEALAQAPLPRFAMARAAASVRADPATVASRLQNLANECGSRLQTTCNRAVSLVNPIALLLVGAALAGMFHRIMLTQALCLQAVTPW